MKFTTRYRSRTYTKEGGHYAWFQPCALCRAGPIARRWARPANPADHQRGDWRSPAARDPCSRRTQLVVAVWIPHRPGGWPGWRRGDLLVPHTRSIGQCRHTAATRWRRRRPSQWQEPPHPCGRAHGLLCNGVRSNLQCSRGCHAHGRRRATDRGISCPVCDRWHHRLHGAVQARHKVAVRMTFWPLPRGPGRELRSSDRVPAGRHPLNPNVRFILVYRRKECNLICGLSTGEKTCTQFAALHHPDNNKEVIG